jgi:hypothetical protein
VALFCNNIIDVAGGSLLYINKLLSILTSAVKDFQLALFLENLKALFFQTGLTNIIRWNISGYLYNTIEVVSKVTAISDLALNL